MTKLIVVCGQRNSGKTTWVCALVSALTKKGFRVGTLKHTHHRHDVEGKDTDKHQVAGAEKVILVSSEGLAIYEPYRAEPSIQEIVNTHFEGYDFVFAEGYRSTDLPKIIVGEDPNANIDNTIARVPAAIEGKVKADTTEEILRELGNYFDSKKRV